MTPARKGKSGGGTVVDMVAHGGNAARFMPEPFMPEPDADQLSVMSFNLRYASARDGHAWVRRLPVMADLIARESPAVIGTQEGLIDQLLELMDELPARYEWTGEGRLGGNADEFAAVIFDGSVLNAVEAENFWLSRTPEVPGSKDWHSSLPRMVTRVKFALPGGHRTFTLFNTHFDHRSAAARWHAAHILVGRAAAEDVPVVVTGDFNAAPGSPEYDVLTGAESPLGDAWHRAGRRVGTDYGTFHGYRGPSPGAAHIDWILSSRGVTVDAVGVNTFSRDGEYPSDHFPLQALVRVPGSV